jgi:ACS family sodium-dependent inorganic phosphate cotransporter
MSATLLFWFFGSAEVQSWNNLNVEPKSANTIISDEEKQINSTTKEVPSSGEEDENERL